MCRLVAYLGEDILIEDVIVKPVNSIVMQSLRARESSVPTNGDGFGLGWYAPTISNEPALFKSVFPAWNDVNLLSLASKIMSPAFFAHVRAASSGGVAQTNCHPFIYQQWMFMHNGEIHDFMAVKRHIRHLLDDDIYNWIKGETDSEHLFALFLQLAKGQDLTQLTVIADLLVETFKRVLHLVKKYGKPGTSIFNICITDGQQLIASRYCSDKNIQPESMHYAIGSRFMLHDKHWHMLQDNKKRACALISSEKLTNFDVEWQEVPANHIVMLDKTLHLQLRSLK
jgi:glutamine amidotransferase